MSSFLSPTLMLFNGIGFSCARKRNGTYKLLDNILHLLLIQRRLSKHTAANHEMALVCRSSQSQYEAKERCEL